MQIKGHSLEVGYGSYIAVSDLDINIEKGKITSIIGPNGSGKSTVLKALTRLIKTKSGSVYIDNKEINKFKTKELSRMIGVLPQRHSAPPDFKVKELVSYGRIPHQKWYEEKSEEDEKIIEWAMKATGIYDLREKSINEISGGESQRVWIATVLTQKPEILFLDEPTTYLDISHQIETMKLVKKLNRESGIGIVMVLHDLSHALEISDRIIIIKDGKKYDEGPPHEVITSKMMKEVYNVECAIVSVENRKKPLIAYHEI